MTEAAHEGRSLNEQELTWLKANIEMLRIVTNLSAMSADNPVGQLAEPFMLQDGHISTLIIFLEQLKRWSAADNFNVYRPYLDKFFSDENVTSLDQYQNQLKKFKMFLSKHCCYSKADYTNFYDA